MCIIYLFKTLGNVNLIGILTSYGLFGMLQAILRCIRIQENASFFVMCIENLRAIRIGYGASVDLDIAGTSIQMGQ